MNILKPIATSTNVAMILRTGLQISVWLHIIRLHLICVHVLLVSIVMYSRQVISDTIILVQIMYHTYMPITGKPVEIQVIAYMGTALKASVTERK